jgi:hypothetical protein
MRAGESRRFVQCLGGNRLLAGLEFRKFRDSRAAIERVAPGIERVANGCQVESAVPRGVGAEISPGAFEHRTASDEVPLRVVVQSHRYLDQALEKLALGLRRGAPDILKDLVSLKKLTVVEEMNAVLKGVRRHERSVAQPASNW